MNIITISFIVTFISGFSTMIGTLLIFLNIKNQKKIISRSLIFSASIMLFISLFDLIPSSYVYFSKIYGFLLTIMLIIMYSFFGSFLVKYIDNNNNISNKLYKVGIISLIALILHNIPEGIITFISTSHNLSVGLSLAISIALHNIPEGIAISVPLFYGEKNKKKAIIYTLIAALSEPFGAFIAFVFLHNINYYLFATILSITAGIMIYLSIFELIKESIKYKINELLLYFILGILVMIISKVII